uniref:Uncharacterized protein n=1 Tax=Magallana gigas TaxID=29159 RepID=K1PLH0_MAGGI
MEHYTNYVNNTSDVILKIVGVDIRLPNLFIVGFLQEVNIECTSVDIEYGGVNSEVAGANIENAV